MRSNLPPREFFDKMKKKPALQAILDDLANYTEEQIAELPGQPQWIKDVLIEKKQRANTLTPDQIAVLMIKNSPKHVNEDFVGEVFEWASEDGWLKAGGLMTEVREGEPIMVVDEAHCYIGHSYVRVDHGAKQAIAAEAITHGTKTREEYKEMHRQFLIKRYK